MAEDRPDSPPPRIPYRPPGVVFIDEGTDGADTGIIGRKRRADFRGAGVVVTDGGDRAIITIDGATIFCYDYLVDALYTGTEGAVISSPDTAHTFKIYSTVKGAVDDANANRQANGQSTSFLICGTGTFEARYQEATQIDLDPPSGGSYHLFGTGADTTQIEGTMASGALFNISTLSLDSQVEFHHIEMKTNESIALIQGGGSTRITLDNCWLRPNDSGARAIEAGLGAVGWNISNTNFEGTGIGIDGGALMNVRLTNCYMGMTVGIRMTNATQVHCTNVKFNCSLYDVEIGATVGAFSFSAGGGCEFNKGIYFTSGASFSWFDNFVVNGCVFIIGSGETGIDYSGATREGALTEAAAHSITGNTFRGSGTAKGIVGGSASADGPHCATVVGNTFEGFTADNEIIDMDLTGDNEVAHNCTDSGATLYDSHIASGDVKHDLLSATHPDTLASAVSRGSLIAGDATPEYAELALGADHRFLGSDGLDAVYRDIGWDVILTPSGTDDHAQINTAIANGAKNILLLAGTHDVGADIDLTGQGGVRLIGQGDATVLDFKAADTQIKVPTGVFTIASLKCLDSTAQDGTIDFDFAGSSPALLLIDDVHFRSCEQAINLSGLSAQVTKVIRNCRVSNPRTAAGTPISYEIRADNVYITGGYLDGASGANLINISGGVPIFLIGVSGRVVSSAFALRIQTGTTIVCLVSTSNFVLASASSKGIEHDEGRLFVTDCAFDADSLNGTGTVINLASSRGASIKGGLIEGGGIAVNCASAGNRISGLEIRRRVGDGIHIASNGNIVTNNYIHDASAGWGIDIASGAGNIVHGNRVIDNSSGQINDAGTDTKLGLNNTTT